MTLKERFLAMLGFRRSNDEQPKPDPLRASLTVALQANERAGERAREAILDVLTTSDKAKGMPRA